MTALSLPLDEGPAPKGAEARLRVLALDCATATGWATNAPGGIESGVQRFELRRGCSPGFRFMEFRLWLTDLVERLRPEVIVYEQAHHRGGAATELCVGFTTRVQEIAAAHGVEYRAVHSATLKVHATGKGNADKPAMIEAARRRFGGAMRGHLVQDDNHADALLLLGFALDGYPEAAAKPKTRKKAKVG